MDDVGKREVRELLRRDPQRALLLARRARGDGDPDVPYLVGVARFRLGEFSAAEKAFHQAISMNAANADAFYYWGLSADRQGRPGDAIKAYRKTVTLNPNHKLARDKLRLLGQPVEPDDRNAERHDRRPSLSKDSSLVLPDTEQDFIDYERRTRRKAIIDARAQNTAQIAGLPWWGKLLLVGIAIFILGIIGTGLYSNFSGSAESEQQQQEEEFQQDVEQQQQEQCELARSEGIALPGC
jgi:tetratricopeptide (TPR) repeat protein